MTVESLRRIRHLSSIIDAVNYLEIGVFTGKVFNNLNFSGKKIAVDPFFQFDKKQFTNSQTSFYECTSDFFFEHFIEDIKFDMVYLDGLHTYEQTFADLCNVLNFCKPETFILLDDIYPIDEFSSLRSQDLCYKQRMMHNINHDNPAAWHGDTYKILYLINHYLRSYDYATIMGSGNPQAVIWKKSLYRQELKTPFKKFKNQGLLHNITETLGSINYFKTMEYYECIFNKVSENILFEYLLSARI